MQTRIKHNRLEADCCEGMLHHTFNYGDAERTRWHMVIEEAVRMVKLEEGEGDGCQLCKDAGIS